MAELTGLRRLAGADGGNAALELLIPLRSFWL
jgi:hypothetical protein